MSVKGTYKCGSHKKHHKEIIHTANHTVGNVSHLYDVPSQGEIGPNSSSSLALKSGSM